MEKDTKWKLLERYKKLIEAEEQNKDEENITVQTLSKDWKDNVYPEIEEKHLQPLIEKMEKCRHEYLHLVKEYFDTLKFHQDRIYEIYRIQPFNNPFLFNEIHNSNHLRNIPVITRQHLNFIVTNHDLPKDIKNKIEDKEISS